MSDETYKMRHVPPFERFHDPVAPWVPQFFWDLETDEQRYLNIFHMMRKLREFCELIGDNSNSFADVAKALQDDFERFKAHGFEDYYERQLKEWINGHVAYLWKTYAKQMYVGLTDDGHYCVYVPDSWSDLSFDVGNVYGRSDYGRLCIKMETEGEGVINNTYSYSLAAAGDTEAEQKATLQRMIADIEVASKISESAYRTLYTPMDKDVPNPTSTPSTTRQVMVTDADSVELVKSTNWQTVSGSANGVTWESKSTEPGVETFDVANDNVEQNGGVVLRINLPKGAYVATLSGTLTGFGSTSRCDAYLSNGLVSFTIDASTKWKIAFNASENSEYRFVIIAKAMPTGKYTARLSLRKV